jgi:hypothetical protein
MIGFVADREIQLGGDHVAVARVAAQCLAEDSFRFSGAILVGSIEESDAVVQGGMNAADGLFVSDSAGDGKPGAEAQFRNFERALAQLAILHSFLPCSATPRGSPVAQFQNSFMRTSSPESPFWPHLPQQATVRQPSSALPSCHHTVIHRILLEKLFDGGRWLYVNT